jgi:hypothetical protein
MAIKLNTGKVAFSVQFDGGEEDFIYFNPNDPDLATRLMATKDKISKRIDDMKFEDFELTNAGEAVEVENIHEFANLTEEQRSVIEEKAENTAKIIEETKKIIFEELNFAFDSDVSSVVFKHCSPFAVVNGEYFIMQFLQAITPEIQKYISKSNENMEKKMSKYIEKYKK